MSANTQFKETMLVRKDEFRSENFHSIEKKAQTVIDQAEAAEVLALTITMSSPFKVVDARKYTLEVFESLLSEEPS
jgi:hypothetical protein